MSLSRKFPILDKTSQSNCKHCQTDARLIFQTSWNRDLVPINTMYLVILKRLFF